MKTFKKFLKDKRGISPIVGVILVVAMTVMLAIIAWSYISGMSASGAKMHQVSATASENATGWITVTYMGGPDNSQVKELKVSVSKGTTVYDIWSVNSSYFAASNGSVTYVSNTTISFSGPDGTYITVSPPGGLGNKTANVKPKVGTVILIQGTPGKDNNHVTVSAVFVDGTTQTIMNTWT